MSLGCLVALKISTTTTANNRENLSVCHHVKPRYLKKRVPANVYTNVVYTYPIHKEIVHAKGTVHVTSDVTKVCKQNYC